jgi:hypothetical protein
MDGQFLTPRGRNRSLLVNRGSIMKNQHESYAIKGLKALKRAAKKAAEDAMKNNLKIPIWKDGKIEYIIPEIDTEQGAAGDAK